MLEQLDSTKAFSASELQNKKLLAADIDICDALTEEAQHNRWTALPETPK